MNFIKQLAVLSIIFLGSNFNAMEMTFHKEVFQNAYAYESKLNNIASRDRSIAIPRETINTKCQQQYHIAQDLRHNTTAQSYTTQQNKYSNVAFHEHPVHINEKEQRKDSFYRPHVDFLKQITSNLQSSVYRDNLIEKKVLVEKEWNRSDASELKKQSIFIDALLDGSIYRMLASIQKVDLSTAMKTFAELEQLWPWVNQSRSNFEENRFIEFLGIDIMQVAQNSLICRKDYLAAYGMLSDIKSFQCCVRNMQLEGNIQGLKNQRSQVLSNYKKNHLQHTSETKAKLTIVNLVLSNPLTQILDTIKNADPDIAAQELGHFKMQLLWHFETKNLKNMNAARADMFNREGVDLLKVADACYESRQFLGLDKNIPLQDPGNPSQNDINNFCNNKIYASEFDGKFRGGTITSSGFIIGNQGYGNNGGGNNNNDKNKPDPCSPYRTDNPFDRKECYKGKALTSQFKQMQLKGEIRELEAKLEELECIYNSTFFNFWKIGELRQQIKEIKAILKESLTETFDIIKNADLDTARNELDSLESSVEWSEYLQTQDALFGICEAARKIFYNRPDLLSRYYIHEPESQKIEISQNTIDQKVIRVDTIDMVSTTVTNCNLTITPEINQRIDVVLDTLNDTSLKAVSESINALITMVQEKNLDAETQNNCFSAGLESNVLLQQYTENQSKHIVLDQNRNMQIVDARKEAFNAVVNNPTVCREQSFTLTHKACALLKSCGFDPEQFIYCVGNETKHQLYSEFVTLLNEIAEIKSRAPIQPLLDMTLTCTCVSKAYMEHNNIMQAFELADCAWASLDCAKEVSKHGIDLQKIAVDITTGIARGLKNAVQNNVNMVLHPVETMNNIATTFCHLAYCFGKFMEPITIHDGDMEVDAELIAKVNAEWKENMQSVIDAAQEITLEGATTFITEFIAGPKITKLGLGVLSHYSKIPIAGLVKLAKEAKETIGDKAQKATSAMRKTLAEQFGHFVKEESIAATTDGVKVTVSNASKEAGLLHRSDKIGESAQVKIKPPLASKVEVQPSSQAVKNAAVIAEEQAAIKFTQSLSELRQSVLNLEKKMLTNDELKSLGFRGNNLDKIKKVNPTTGHIRAHTEIQTNAENAKKIFDTVKKEFESRKLISEGTIAQENNGVQMIFCDFEDGSRVQIRTEGKSGHPKIDINDVLANTYEKITFK